MSSPVNGLWYVQGHNSNQVKDEMPPFARQVRAWDRETNSIMYKTPDGQVGLMTLDEFADWNEAIPHKTVHWEHVPRTIDRLMSTVDHKGCHRISALDKTGYVLIIEVPRTILDLWIPEHDLGLGRFTCYRNGKQEFV